MDINSEIIKETIKNNLILYRKINGLTQIEVAKALNLKDFSTYRSWETGRSTPPHYRLFQLAEKYNIGIEKFYENCGKASAKVASPVAYESDTYGDKYLSELNKDEKMLIMQYRTLNSADRKKLEDCMNRILIEKMQG